MINFCRSPFLLASHTSHIFYCYVSLLLTCGSFFQFPFRFVLYIQYTIKQSYTFPLLQKSKNDIKKINTIHSFIQFFSHTSIQKVFLLVVYSVHSPLVVSCWVALLLWFVCLIFVDGYVFVECGMFFCCCKHANKNPTFFFFSRPTCHLEFDHASCSNQPPSFP
jgi:hypothetical protein